MNALSTKLKYAALVGVTALASLLGAQAYAAPPASYTTTNSNTELPGDGPGHCFNGGTSGDPVNCNIYDAKKHVWLNGGPLAASLPDGDYFFVVMNPGTQNAPNDDNSGVLSLVADGDPYANRSFNVTNKILSYDGNHDKDGDKIRLGISTDWYHDTANNGGVYVIGICRMPDGVQPIVPRDCKYDAFKILEQQCTPVEDNTCCRGQTTEDPCVTCTADCRIFKDVKVRAFKWLDVNGPNGALDDAETGLAAIRLTATFNTSEGRLDCDPSIVSPESGETDAEGFYTFANCRLPLKDDFGNDEIDPYTSDVYKLNFTVCETLPTTLTWRENYPIAGSTLSNSSSTTVYDALGVLVGSTICWDGTVEAGTADVAFGNACETPSAGYGHTLGFWSNKNGQAMIGADDLAALVALNLRNANGTAYDPATKTSFRTWILNATATNMAYMLSAQLAAMQLNVINLNGGVASGYIYAPGTNSANSLGYASIADIMAEADQLLLDNPIALSGNPERARMAAVKTALDKANNNLNWVGTAETCVVGTAN